MSDAPRIPVFAARALTKVYQMGEVEVQALRGVDFDLFSARVRRPARPVRKRASRRLLNILGGLGRARPQARSSTATTT